MPLTIQPVSRRSFCRTALAAALAGGAKNAWAGEPARDHWVFLSDTHMPGDPDKKYGGRKPCKDFADTRDAVFKLIHKPKGVIITGDLACTKGEPDEYSQIAGQTALYTATGIPVHICMGNHDNLGNFLAAFPGAKNAAPPVADRHVAVLETPNANLFLLDTLNGADASFGLLGEEQLRWLRKALDARKDKPALLFAHHDLGNKKDSLRDRDTLWADIVKPSQQVKAYIHGHTHISGHSVRDGVHLINLPAMASGDGDKCPSPLGWMEADISGRGIQLTRHTLNPDRPENGDMQNFEWQR